MILEHKICACGTMMTPAVGMPDLQFCNNCDTVQASECEPGGNRLKTVADHRYDLHWARRVRQEFTGKAAA